MRVFIIEPCKTQGKYILIERYINKKHNIYIEAGFKSNGASVPRLFWWLLPPFHPDYIEACFVHDKFCDMQKYRQADKLFNALLKEHPRSKKYRRVLFVGGVKLWHFIAYREDNKPRMWLKLIKK